jgi:hypothetical protein
MFRITLDDADVKPSKAVFRESPSLQLMDDLENGAEKLLAG